MILLFIYYLQTVWILWCPGRCAMFSISNQSTRRFPIKVITLAFKSNQTTMQSCAEMSKAVDDYYLVLSYSHAQV